MQPLTDSAERTDSRPQAVRGRWIWLLTGTITFVTIGTLSGWAIVRAERTPSYQAPTTVLPVRTLTVTQPVTALNVQSYGAPIKVTTTHGGPVTIAEMISYQGTRPAVTHRVSHSLLTLAAPACANSDCEVAFSVTVPSGVQVTAAADGGSVSVIGTGAADIDSGGGPVYAASIGGPLTVTAEGGQVTVAHAAGADIDSGGGSVTATGIDGKLSVRAEGGGVNVSQAPTAAIDSGGGPVYAAGIGGPLTVAAEGGQVTVSGAGTTQVDSGGGPVTANTISGPLSVRAEGGQVEASDVSGELTVDTGGGNLSAAGLTSPTATVNGEGGTVTLGFSTAPTMVQVDTGGGNASLSVPADPYAITTDTGGSQETLLIGNTPGASRLINVSTEGGSLQIGPA